MERNQLRAQLGIPLHSYVMVGVAKLLPRKRPLDMVRVLPGLPTQVHLVWVGSGEMEQAVRAEAALLGVASRVHLPGFRSAEETWRILGVSDLFVMPSENEPWGLAINEAVAAGLPALVSEECGAAEDLVVRDRTGEILRVGDLSSWTSAVERWYHRAAAGDRGDTGHMKRRADAHSIDCAATATEEAVLAVTSSR
jgi:glycosyltransferase involved in cell wall biosynthesis